MQSKLEHELAKLLVEVLELEDYEPNDIDPQAPLFGHAATNSLGLDSIDALEIALAVAKKYGVQLKADDENNRHIFYSLATLADYVTAQRAG